jgi:hypothetical protein
MTRGLDAPSSLSRLRRAQAGRDFEGDVTQAGRESIDP